MDDPGQTKQGRLCVLVLGVIDAPVCVIGYGITLKEVNLNTNSAISLWVALRFLRFCIEMF